MKTVAKALIYDSANNLLILRRSLSHPHFPHHLDFPGGEVETDESEAKAIIREIAEETSIAIDAEGCVLAYRQQVSPQLVHLVYVAKVKNIKPSPTLSWEHDGFEWMSIEQFIAMPLPTNIDNYHETVLTYLATLS